MHFKSLKICRSLCYPKTLKFPLQHSLTPSTLITRCGGGDRSPVPLELNQELHALARTATADCSVVVASLNLELIFNIQLKLGRN